MITFNRSEEEKLKDGLIYKKQPKQYRVDITETREYFYVVDAKSEHEALRKIFNNEVSPMGSSGVEKVTCISEKV